MSGTVGSPLSLRVGAAKVSISPDESFFPITFFGSIQITGVYSEIFTRVILIDNGVTAVALVSFDLGSVPRRKTLRQMIAGELSIPEENVFLTATHNHSAPFLPDELGEGIGFSGGNPKLEEMALMCQGRCMEVVRQAKAAMQPARYGFGTGKSFINVNRDYCYEDGYDEGINYERPSDKTLALARFETLDGTPIAFLINYAVHAVGECMAGRESNNTRISGDLPGITSSYLEQRHGDGVVALWTCGAAGDQNPTTRNFYPVYRPDGSHTWDQVGEGIRGYIRHLGIRHAVDALQLNERISAIQTELELSVASKTIKLPGQKPDMSAMTGAPGASRKFQMVEGAPVDVRLQMLRLGDVVFYFLSGELVTSIGLKIKKVSPVNNTVVVTLSDGYSGYIIDEFGYDNKTFEYNLSRIAKCDTEKAVVGAFTEMLGAI